MRVGRTGQIGASDADIGLLDDSLHLRWRGVTFDLTRAVVRHRDDDGRIQFTVTNPDGTHESADYARRGPSEEDRRMDAIDFTAEEPWTWEDSDFGLFVFHVATGTGPIKYRHTLDTSTPARAPRSFWPPVLVGDTLQRRREHARSESVDLDRLVEVRAKFEVSGIWSAATLLTLDDGDGLVVVPIDGDSVADWVDIVLAPVLAARPGWGPSNDERLERAVTYARRRQVGPADGERLDDWAEWSIWER
ncbi:MAG: hypothetical protein JHD16_09750 [Solirubrobacteraceae bacterium]|nr:hypothetical protein [Solirubrobacteraceae bacterium]